MKTDTIQQLLNKFYLGETSLEEEKILSDFFRQEDVPDEFLPDKKLFLVLNEKPVEVPLETSENIEMLIDSFKDGNLVKKNTKKLQLLYLAMGVAASLALFFGVNRSYQKQQTKDTLFTDTYSNPDDAYRATMDALHLFSQNFSKGTETVEKANAHLEQTQEIINQSFK